LFLRRRCFSDAISNFTHAGRGRFSPNSHQHFVQKYFVPINAF
jgi:hypothetical protein